MLLYHVLNHVAAPKYCKTINYRVIEIRRDMLRLEGSLKSAWGLLRFFMADHSLYPVIDAPRLRKWAHSTWAFMSLSIFDLTHSRLSSSNEPYGAYFLGLMGCQDHHLYR
ncbi:Acriflavine sensitivity control protein acr-2 [Fusarium oxysporum f. sp. albedinis]|nr:Acriflavine sensitivity control protein acr-2 [Fusarium oxysporum f. sp. albedinis]